MSFSLLFDVSLEHSEKPQAQTLARLRPEANLYVAGGVLAATIQTKFSTLPQKPSSAKKTGNRDIAAMRSGRTSRASRPTSCAYSSLSV